MNDWKNTIKRVLKTFIQAALGYAVGAISGTEGITKTVIILSVAAGLAAVMNLPTDREPDIELIDGAAVVKRSEATIEEAPLAGQDDMMIDLAGKYGESEGGDNE